MEYDMKKENKNISTKDFDEPLLPESLKSSGSLHEGVIINNVDKRIDENKKNGKVFMLNYFDTNSGGFKKILVKKFN